MNFLLVTTELTSYRVLSFLPSPSSPPTHTMPCQVKWNIHKQKIKNKKQKLCFVQTLCEEFVIRFTYRLYLFFKKPLQNRTSKLFICKTSKFYDHKKHYFSLEKCFYCKVPSFFFFCCTLYAINTLLMFLKWKCASICMYHSREVPPSKIYLCYNQPTNPSMYNGFSCDTL